MKLLIATRNVDKCKEIRSLFSLPELEVISALDFPDLPEVEEDGSTCTANAVKKAVTLAKASGLWALADDSGLEVDALHGEPGVFSARYAGEDVGYEENNEKVLKALGTEQNRRAQFSCVIALSSPRGKARVVEGICLGSISRAPRGRFGFGYDPIFIPDGSTKTFAELDPADKNVISHRGRALRKAKKAWGSLLVNELLDWPSDG